jgi:hypothetical protein
MRRCQWNGFGGDNEENHHEKVTVSNGYNETES